MQVLRIKAALSPTPIFLHVECCIRCPTRRGQEQFPELLWEGQGSLAARLPRGPVVHSLCLLICFQDSSAGSTPATEQQSTAPRVQLPLNV